MKVKTPTVFQMEATECGAASLAMILAYWKCFIPLEQLRIDTGVSRDGCNAKNLLRGSRKYGLEAHGYYRELESLKKMDFPCIIHWNFNHFVVLEGFKGEYAFINDPAYGHRRVTMDELDACFTGVVLTFKKTDAFSQTQRPKTLQQFICKRLKGQTGAITMLVALGLLLVVPGVLLSVCTQLFVDKVLYKTQLEWVARIIVIIVLTAIIQGLLGLYRATLQEKLSLKMSMISSHSFFYHMLRLPMSFFDQRSLGDLVGRNGNNDTVNAFITGDLATAALNLLTSCFYIVLLICYSPTLTLIGLTSIAISVVISHLSSKYMEDMANKAEADAGKFNGVVYSGISIMETLKASGVENDYCSRILGQQAKAAELEQKSIKVQRLISSLAEIVEQVFSVLMIIIGGIFVIRGNITAGMLVAFISLFSQFSGPVQTLINFIQRIHTLKADMNRVEDVMSYETDQLYKDETAKIEIREKLAGKIEVDDISFGYSKLSPPLIDHFNLRLSPGKSIALVGSSGSGKSTVSKLISGLYAPWSGEIRFDGKPCNEISLSVKNASIATVSQDVVLFSGTIRDNLTMWNVNVLEGDVIAAAKDACIHDIITSKPGAYDYHLSEDAANLSGGQRQRLEIARALAQNPSILVLDEATSALDPITEKAILDNIKARGCSCIVVAHRLSAVRDCDEIIVLERGHIVQRGTHNELMASEGQYRELVRNM